MTKKIAIIDYKMGNIKSVQKAFKYMGFDAELTKSKRKIKNSFGLVLPGVGAFGDAVKNLHDAGIFELLKTEILNGKPFLGICLGLQLLFQKSEENKGIEGLSVFKGSVKKFKLKNLKIPHIGWNQINIVKRNSLLNNIKNNAFFYFVHSYYVLPTNKKIISTTTDYGINFVSGVNKDNIFAFQFHPEKSHNEGLTIIKNFGELCVSNSGN